MTTVTTVQVEFWQLVLLLVAFFGACAAGGKLLLDQTQRHLDSRFKAQEETRASNHTQLSQRLDAIETANRQEANEWQRVERDFLRFQADLPLHYVRREDYIRGQSVIEAKLDGLASKLENAQLRGIIQGGIQ
jgi:hypothetical protein